MPLIVIKPVLWILGSVVGWEYLTKKDDGETFAGGIVSALIAKLMPWILAGGLLWFFVIRKRGGK